jgi:hypothetical protein
MATRWALVGTLALAAVGCSGSENGRYVPIGQGVWVLDTRTGRACVPQREQHSAFDSLWDGRPIPDTLVALCVDLGKNVKPKPPFDVEQSAKPKPPGPLSYEEWKRQRSTPDTTARP